MTTQPVEANVVLTTDNTQYDQAMSSSAAATSNLVKGLDSLGKKINDLSRSAGRSLIGISAADVAVIGSATAAWASYERQVSRLQAQAAIVTRTNDQQTKVMKDYTAAVKGLRTEYGTTTSEAEKLVETLSKVTSLRQTRDLQDLSKVFADMSKATGESSQGLASSLTNLQKVMGTPINESRSRRYADMFTYLSARTNASAQGLIDFTAQLAPVGEAMGMNTKQVAGFATAFAQAGQEGQAATTVFNKVASDITRSIATGSQEVAHYANLVGLSERQFRRMDGAEQVIRILEALGSRGQSAASEFERLGLEGPRSIKALQAVISQSGGVRQAYNMAITGVGSGAAGEGAEAAMQGVSDEFEKLREQVKMTAETFGEYWAPVAEGFIGGMAEMAQITNRIVEGPLGQFMALIAGAVAPLAGGAGALAMFAGTLLKVATAFTVVRNSASRGLWEGMRGGAGMTLDPTTGVVSARGGGMLGPRGAQIAERGSWFQRGLYNAGQLGGAGVAGLWGGALEGATRGREWWDPEYQRGPGRGPLSYVAGGLGRGIEMALTPQLDQMRQGDPTKRTPWASRYLPWTRRGLEGNLEAVRGAATGYEQQLLGLRQEELGIRKDTSLTDTGRAADLERLRTAKEETKLRLDQARQTASTIDAELSARRMNTRELGSSTTGFTRLASALGGFGSAAVGSVAGAGRVGFDALRGSPLAAPLASMAGMAGLSATGVDSNALMLAAMGGTLGLPGAAVGFAAGGAMDLASADDEATNAVKNFAANVEEASQSGLGLFELEKDARSASRAVQDYAADVEDLRPLPFLTDTADWLKSSRDVAGGIFGTSRSDELAQDEQRAAAERDRTERVIRDLGEAMGEEFTGTRRNQLRQMEEFMSTRGMAQLGQAGVDFGDLTYALRNTTLTGDYQAWLARATKANPSDITARLVAGGGVGAMLATSPIAQRSQLTEGDVELFYRAINEVFESASEQGKSNLEFLKETQQARRRIGDENNATFEQAAAIQQRAMQFMQMAAPSLGRVGGFRQQLAIGQTMASVAPSTPQMRAQVEQGRMISAQAFVDMDQYFRQLLLAQDQYELSRSRAQEDYNLQRTYQEYDFSLSRERAEDAFNRGRARAVEDFYRGQRRAQYSFNLQRHRAEEDFNHQIGVMAQQQAESIYNVYERVQTQRTSSAEWVLTNANDQLRRIEEQTDNLDRLRRMGLSNAAISQFGLNDPNNAQQLARNMGEFNPELVDQYNRVARRRTRATRELITDESSLEFSEMRRSFELNMSRSAEDFERQMRESRQDFQRGLRRQRTDFSIMMDQQAEDYATGMERQEQAYKLQMDRAAEDMANMSNEILLSQEDVLTEAGERLTGSAGKQARQVLSSFRTLKTSSSAEAIATMKDLAKIFGFEYTEPRLSSNGSAPGGRTPSAGSETTGQVGVAGQALGGVIPGWSPGRDDQMVPLSGGEAIMRPEWARAVGRETIDQMNHAARYGGFFLGGIMPLEGGSPPGPHHSAYPNIDYVGDINGPYDLRNPPARVMAWKAGQVADVSYGSTGYGNNVQLNHAGGQHTRYAHLSSIVARMGQMLAQGQMLGRVGNTGNSFGAHLHFEIDGGNIAMGDLGDDTAPGAPSIGRSLRGVLKRRYPQSEAAAVAMAGVHPLGPGMISKVINRLARRKIRELHRQYGLVTNAPMDSLTGLPTDAQYGGDAQGVWNALIAAGFSKIHAAGIMGNIQSESGFDPFIIQGGGHSMNPANAGGGGYGLVQWTPGAKLTPYLNGKPPSVATEVNALVQQLAGRGTSPEGAAGIALRNADSIRDAALAFELRYERHAGPPQSNRITQAQAIYNRFAAKGGIVNGARGMVVGEAGPEAIIPLDSRGGQFMAEVMSSVMGGRQVTPVRGGGTNVFAKVDKSTTFTGPITVQANDPNELVAKLRARQRVMALSRPSLTGSAA